MASGQNRPAGRLDLAGALAPYRGPWDTRRAAHLLRRAGFGGTTESIARIASMRPHEAVESLIRLPDANATNGPDDVFDPRAQLLSLRAQMRGADSQSRRDALKALRKSARESVVSMQTWWLNRMLTTPAPLQEKMTLFFHGHFTSAAIQKGAWPNYVWQQNQLFRTNALGNLRDLTLAVSKDPAMLIYLDNARSNKTHPNENYARELMELFTLGHGNYTEEDIRQSARAFTGWTLDRRSGQFAFVPQLHDEGTKTFLGLSGNLDGADIVDRIYRQPACARFWAQSLLGFFLYSDPEPELVDAFATVIRKNDFHLAPVMSTLLQSNVFYSERAYRALVKSPVEYVIGTYNALGLTAVDRSAIRPLAQMGQVLFEPPNVAGWPGGENWITSQSIIARHNFVAALVNSPMISQSSWLDGMPPNADGASRALVSAILQNDAPDQARTQLVSYLDGSGTAALKMFSGENFQERVRGAAYLTMTMPTYQLS